jgi:hypothetical protein
MRCLRADQIYLYLEKELTPPEIQKIKEHLTSCPACQKAVEERKILLQASESLPLWEIPPDFACQVMERISPKKVPLRSWLAAAAAGLLSISLTFFIFFVLSGENFLEVVFGLGHGLLELVRTASVLLIKVFKLISLLIKVINQLLGFLFEGFIRFTSILNPEVQIILIVLTIILSLTLIFGVRRKFIGGEKS